MNATQSEQPNNSWRASRDERLNQFVNAYKRDDVSLFVGAGASMGAGLPRWSEVLDSLLDDLIEQSGAVQDEPIAITPSERKLIAESFFRKHAASPLYAARYMRAALGDRFEQRLADALYCPGGTACRNQSSPVLDALAELCVARQRNTSIVTYNFDDLLERALNARGAGFETLLSQRRHSNALPIYHVHGFLPREPLAGSKASSSLVVFSEERYHEIYARPDHWSNVVQLSMLRERTCALVGLSLNDPNLRRLLELAAQSPDSPRHYVFLRRTTAREVHGGNDGAIRPQVVDAMIDTHHKMSERSLAELGLTVIWVDGHQELPSLLGRIAGAAKEQRQPPPPPLDTELCHAAVESLPTQAQ